MLAQTVQDMWIYTSNIFGDSGNSQSHILSWGIKFLLVNDFKDTSSNSLRSHPHWPIYYDAVLHTVKIPVSYVKIGELTAMGVKCCDFPYKLSRFVCEAKSFASLSSLAQMVGIQDQDQFILRTTVSRPVRLGFGSPLEQMTRCYISLSHNDFLSSLFVAPFLTRRLVCNLQCNYASSS
jgi:hypothetical protein